MAAGPVTMGLLSQCRHRLGLQHHKKEKEKNSPGRDYSAVDVSRKIMDTGRIILPYSHQFVAGRMLAPQY